MKPIQILTNCLAIAIVVVLPHLGLVPGFAYSLPLLVFVWLVLRRSGEKFSDIGFRMSSFRARLVLVGAVAAIAILSFMQLLVFPLVERFLELESTDLGIADFVRSSKAQFVFLVVFGWLIGGFYEEIVFRGFIFSRLEKMLPAKHATASSAVIACILFGAYHLQMGSAGAFNALLVGALYQGLFLYFDRNLWASILCHGMYNTLVITLIYLGHL